MKNGFRLNYPILEQGSDEWLELRKKQAATCSNFANAYGIGYKSRNAYMRLKLGIDKPDEMNEVMRFGIDYEDHVVLLYKEFMRKNGVNVKLETYGYRRFTDDPDSGGSPDRLVTDIDTGERWVLEIKTRLHGGIRDHAPISHQLQCVALGKLFGVQHVDYICWSPDDAIFVSRITWDNDFWQHYLWPEIKRFNDHWRAGKQMPNMKRGDRQERMSIVDEMVFCNPIFASTSHEEGNADDSECCE